MFMTALRLSALCFAVAALGPPQPWGASTGAQRSFSDQTPTPPPSQPPEQKVAPLPHPISRSPLRLALPRREYLCAGGARIVVLIETNAVRLTLNNRIYNLKQVDANSPTKYAAGSVVWSSTGEEGFLVDNADAAHPKMLAEQCHLQSSYPPTASTAGSMKGTATFGSYPVLPGDAVLIVQLRDLNKDADDAAAVLAEERVPVGGRKSPISFALTYDPARITTKSPSAISASITGRGKLLFVLVRPVTIADTGNPGPVALALSRATSATKAPPVPEAPPHL
jgi:putative lipoprotein